MQESHAYIFSVGLRFIQITEWPNSLLLRSSLKTFLTVYECSVDVSNCYDKTMRFISQLIEMV